MIVGSSPTSFGVSQLNHRRRGPFSFICGEAAGGALYHTAGRSMRFEYWQASNGRWHWHLKGAGGEKIAQGEGYETEADLLRTISLVKGSSTAPVYKLTTSAA